MNLLTILNFLLLLILAFFVYRLSSHYRSLTKNTKKKDLITILDQILESQAKQTTSLDDINESITNIQKDNRNHFQKLGFIRFNPFSDTGGNQSFCLCLLDENDTGLVISSLHSRENTRIYAKQVRQGKSPDQSLSKEELEALKLAQKS